MKSKVYLNLEYKNCDVEIWLNDIPLERLVDKEQPKFSRPGSYYLVDGINKMELVVNPGPTPSRSKKGRTERSQNGIYASLKMVKYPLGVYPGDSSGQLLAKVEYRGIADQTDVFPKILSAESDLGKQQGKWLWQNAEKITLSEQNMQDIVSVLQKMHKALIQFDGKTLLNISKIRLEEGDRGMDAKETEEQNKLFLETIDEYKTYKDWQVLPIIQKQFDFRIVANGRMVDCMNRDWTHVLRTAPLEAFLDDPYDYSVKVSKINGEWRVVR